ncbi:cytochrome bd ubiquinol oxidase [Moesziomyces antarcticus]|uniref:Cytochrome b-c1 complex subunit 7 n=2 Tax=Pseudozyma antarctica TaxID=84753 RepID=A0A081CP23_PSEA2|nr:cytochrome bd ubiquinol oxidase [Moesziomyces antarcticus]GAK68419.1 cytochrome bd ubiquinol oxidase [Moesziomyces antarcticus]SPO47341.1 probable ubiquinol--cytochrome-c reductase [Moesziomyces antarcticus]
MVLALSGLSLAKYVQSSPALMRMLKPVANAYANATGHRQMGLRYDDLLVEESPRVQKALSRLPEREAYDRAFRLRQASQLSVLHRELPKDQWLPAKEDKRYLTPYVAEVAEEESERAAWDTVAVKKGH